MGHLPTPAREGERDEGALIGGNRQLRVYAKLITGRALLSCAKPFLKTQTRWASFRSGDLATGCIIKPLKL